MYGKVMAMGSAGRERHAQDHPVMSRRGNCWDNSVAESFFGSLTEERIRGKVCPSRDAARSDVFGYIEVFHNRQRRHGHNGGLAPMAVDVANSTRPQ